jgi:cytochrome c556
MRSLSTRLGLAVAFLTFLALGAAVAVSIATDSGTLAVAADDPAPAPVAGISNVMNAVNHDQHGLYGLVKAFCSSDAPDKAGWSLARHRAQMVAEAGNTLMGKSPPRGADDAAGLKKWKQHCADFRAAGKSLAKAMAIKKPARVKAAIQAVEAQCTACHDDHKSN